MKKNVQKDVLPIFLSDSILPYYRSFSAPSHAYAEELPDGKFIVFVLDASGSMKTDDCSASAIDTVDLTLLPSDYQVGFCRLQCGDCCQC